MSTRALRRALSAPVLDNVFSNVLSGPSTTNIALRKCNPVALSVPKAVTRSASTTTARSTLGSSSLETIQHNQRIAPASSPLSSTVRELLPLLQAQGPHYITVHIHGFPYLITQGDTVRLPFVMHGVQPGDIIRLNSAVVLGSRDYTLKAAAPAPKSKSSFISTPVAQGLNGPLEAQVESQSEEISPNSAVGAVAPHFIPHIAKGKHGYLDDRLFVCRAVVMGVENEPMREKEKTKRRQRHVQTIRSKHRYTILKIKELTVRGLEEIEGPSS